MTASRDVPILLTPHQQKAMRWDRHLSVTANAGSGKTRVLVERYLDLVLSGAASVREIVALTYTDRAASELRRKIAEEISGRLAGGANPDATRRLEAVRDDLASSTIGTIHAFCSRILREHPVEADVDASFAVIEGLDQRALLEESVGDTFRRILAPDGMHNLRQEVLDVIRSLGRSFVVRFVVTMADRRSELEHLDGPGGIYNRADEEILSLWRERLQAMVEDLLGRDILRDDLTKIVNAAAGKQAPAVADHLQDFLEAREPLQRSAAFATLLEIILTKKGELQIRFIGNAALRQTLIEETRRVYSISNVLTPILPLMTGDQGDSRHRLLLKLTKTLLAVVREAEETYERRKHDAGQLDYEDLQLKARDLLKLEAVRKHLQTRFAFVMVDEYQDTNQLQYDILLPLLDDLTRGNLFIVGDPKQSIYSFRQANVEVFERTREHIQSVSGVESNVVLGESFRPLLNLAAFVNLVFSQLMQRSATAESGSADQGNPVRYETLVRARQNPGQGRVEVMLSDPIGGQSLSEADMIARRILQLIASRQTVYDKQEKPHPARFGDIAILLRARSNLPELEQALLRAGIPYSVSGGVGYFQTQDILDIYNYLAFLVNPADDVALAGVLRSPFFAVSDADLFDVAFERGAGSLWEHLNRIGGRREIPEAVRHAWSVLREDSAVALRFPVPELIARIVSRTHYSAKISGNVRAAQVKANLGKLRRIARAYDVQGFASLFDFVARLRGLIDEEEREGQGSVDETGDAVQVMTVHGAKGLEFPIVILPFLNRKYGKENEFFVDEKLGIGFSLPDGAEKKIRPPLTAFLRQLNQIKEGAEEQRVFYVACTRARDMLVLSMHDSADLREPSAGEWLLRSIAPAGIGDSTLLEYANSTGILKLQDGTFVPSVIRHTLQIHIIRQADLGSVQTPIALQPTAVSDREVFIDPVPPVGGSEIFSATKVRTFIECPSRYFLRYVLGFPVGTGPFARSDDDEMRDLNLPADLRGRLVHAVAQRLALSIPTPALIRSEVNAALDRESSFGVLAGESGLAETIAIVDRLVGSSVWGEMALGTDTKTEFTVSTAMESNFLTGTLDRVYRDQSGNLVIVDYKTDQVKRSMLEERGNLYWPQLEFYALLVSEYFHAPEVNAILLFLDHVDAPLRRTFLRADLDRIRTTIAGVINRIQKNEFKTLDPSCPDCPLAPAGCNQIIWARQNV